MSNQYFKNQLNIYHVSSLMTSFSVQRVTVLRKLQQDFERTRSCTNWWEYYNLLRRIRTLKRSFIKSQHQKRNLWIFEYLKSLNDRGLFYNWENVNLHIEYDEFDGDYAKIAGGFHKYGTTKCTKKFAMLNEKDVSIKIFVRERSYQHNIIMVNKGTVQVQFNERMMDICLFYLPHYNCYELGGIFYKNDQERVFFVINEINPELLVQTYRYRKALRTFNKYIPELVREFLWIPIYPSGRTGYHARKTWELCREELKAMESNTYLQ